MLLALPTAWVATAIDVASVVSEAGSTRDLRRAIHLERRPDDSSLSWELSQLKGSVRGGITALAFIDVGGITAVILGLLVLQPSTLEPLLGSSFYWASWALIGLLNPAGAVIAFFSKALDDALSTNSGTVVVGRVTQLRVSAKTAIAERVAAAASDNKGDLSGRIAKIEEAIRSRTISVDQFFAEARSHFGLSTVLVPDEVEVLLKLKTPTVDQCVTLFFAMRDAGANRPLIFFLRFLPPESKQTPPG